MPVELRPENLLAWKIYSHVRGQIITQGMDGLPVDISIPAVETTMAWMGVKKKNRGKVGFKVLQLARHHIKNIREEARQKRQTDEKQEQPKCQD